jgi:hypothetical protein
MARKRYTAEEIISHLRTVEIETAKGIGISDACRKLGVTEQSFDTTTSMGSSFTHCLRLVCVSNVDGGTTMRTGLTVRWGIDRPHRKPSCRNAPDSDGGWDNHRGHGLSGCFSEKDDNAVVLDHFLDKELARVSIGLAMISAQSSAWITICPMFKEASPKLFPKECEIYEEAAKQTSLLKGGQHTRWLGDVLLGHRA